MYALENQDHVPIGYRRINPAALPAKGFNSMVYSGTTGKYCLFGILYMNGRMREPEAFFCPSNLDPQSDLQSEVNPWPPGPDGPSPTVNAFAGYGCRPEVELADEFHIYGNVVGTPPVKTPVPKLNDFKFKAIFADLTATPMRVDRRHKTGVNALYGDGSAMWSDRGGFDADLKACTGVTASFNPNQDRIWGVLDLK
jgi:prepilin-type processing-associated H-X9-DG protein